MKHILFVTGFLILLVDTTFGQVVSNPVIDFLSRHTDSSTGELFPGESWKGRSDAQPPGGYLLRFEAPIGPNGSPVLFVAASILADLRTSTWDAYTRNADRGYTLAAGDVTFGAVPRFYLLGPSVNGNLGLAEIFASKAGYSVLTYFVDKSGRLQQGSLGGISRDQDKEDNDPKFEDTEMGELVRNDKLSKEFTPNVEKILLGEYLKEPSAKWRSFNSSFDVDSQDADTNEKRVLLDGTLDKTSASALLRRNVAVKQ
jgi:hypothetical protein